MRVGFLVNPVAGLGGAVGLKGSDGEEVQREARERGAEQTSPARAVEALKGIRMLDLDIEFVTCAGEMGKEELDRAGLVSEILCRPKRNTTRQDTVDAAEKFLDAGADLIVFAGGDGTARDVLEAVDRRIPIIGIPAGVKMHSAVFVMSPAELPELLTTFHSSRACMDAEVMDIDEDKYRRGVLEAKLYGVAKVPADASLVQAGKTAYHAGTADDEAEELGQYMAETMRPGVGYILGPGSTTAAVTKTLGLEKTVLGVDVIVDRKIVVKDASEKDLLSFLENAARTEIVVTPIGAQGFILGRGNQQLSPKVLRRVGPENIRIIATPTKLKGTPALHVDTGDPELDEALKGRTRVTTGYRRRKLMRIT